MALREVTLLLGACAMAVVVAAERNATRTLGLISSGAAAFYAAVVLLLVTAVMLSGAAMERTDLFVGYENHRIFNHVQTAALPMVLAVACAAELPRWHRRMAGFALVAGCFLLFASAGRGTFVALTVSSLMTGLLLGRQAWPVLKTLALAMAGGLAVFAVVFLLFPGVTQPVASSFSDYTVARIGSDQSRGYLWQVAWQQIVASPWFGIGPMHGAHWPNLKAAHPHNIYLQLAAEWGVPVLLLAVVGGAMFLRRMVGAIRVRVAPTRVGVALLIGCLAVAVDGVVSGNFVMPVSQVWIAVLIGWSVAWMRGEQHIAREAPAKAQGAAVLSVRAMAGAVLMMHFWLGWSIAPEVRNMDAHLARALESFPSERTQPRFWSHGRF
jgi:O-antigen ligase